MTRVLTVVAAQVRPVPFDPVATFDKFEAEVRMLRASFPAADVHVFPELYLTGDHPFAPGEPRGYRETLPEPVPGPLTERIGRLAARVRRWVAAGSILERDGDRIHNTAVVFSPRGELVVAYRKLFPWRPFEGTHPGERPAPVFRLGKGSAGVMICYDGWFPEVARGLALAGAELILHPTLTTTPDREEELVLARANAIANQCYVVNVNAVPAIGGGRSVAVDPEGRVLFEGGGGEEFLPVVLDLDRVRTVRERGTRGLNRVLRHLREAPSAVFEPYRRLDDRDG